MKPDVPRSRSALRQARGRSGGQRPAVAGEPQPRAAFLEEALRQKLHVQHAVLLQPIIEQAIRKQMRGISTRLAWLLVRVAYDSGQTRSLVTNVLGRQPGVTPEILKTILDNSNKTARGNITRRTPQLTELIEAVEDWIQPEGVEQGDT